MILFFACEDIIVKPSNTDQNDEDFKVTWGRINNVYPFLKFKNLYRDSIYAVYCPRAEAANGDV